MKLTSHLAVEGLGGEVNRKKAICESHGDFISICRRHFAGRVVWSRCPTCLSKEKAEESNVKLISESLLSSIGIGPRFMNSSIGNYIPRNESQARAKKAVSRYGAAFNTISNGAGLILCGDTDSGKTHLVSALTHGLLLNGKKVRLMNAIDVVRFVRRAYSDKSLSEESQIEFLANLDLLVIDEVGVQMGSSSELVILFDVINRRYTYMKPTIAVSNMSANEVSDFLTPRTYRRILGSGLVLDIKNWSEM